MRSSLGKRIAKRIVVVHTRDMNTTTYTVPAQSAPIGIQLWPTRHPKYAPNFTLSAVEVINERVQWTYENGNVRWFAIGEQVVCGEVAA